jgi:hypothetical protein
MEYRTMIFALVVVLLLIQLFVSAGVVGGAWKANMDAAGVAFPVLVLVGTVALYSMKESTAGVTPSFQLTSQ